MTIDIDALKQDKRPQSSTIVHALIDRLEAAEKEREELHALIAAVKKQANAEYRIRVKKEEECALLQAKISDLTINVEYLGNLKKSYEELIGELQDDRDELRAKIAEMEQQEPFAWIVRGGIPGPAGKS